MTRMIKHLKAMRKENPPWRYYKKKERDSKVKHQKRDTRERQKTETKK